MNSTVFRDLTMLMVLGFVAMVVMMIPFLNPPAQDDQREPPGNVVVHVFWPNDSDSDVDLWVHGPGEARPVGYSNTNGLLWNLLRDDMGFIADAGHDNVEDAFTRGIIPGEYIINLHCYRCSIPPIPVEVEIGVKVHDGKYRAIAVTNVTLMSEGQERTALRFALNADGTLVEDSMHRVYKPLRSMTVMPGPGGH